MARRSSLNSWARSSSDRHGAALLRASWPALGPLQRQEGRRLPTTTPKGQLVIDDPKIRQNLVKAIDSYTAIYRKGCTPPDAVGWDDHGNNQAVLAQTVVMTVNLTLTIPNALRAERPEDYHKNAATIEWPDGADGQPLAIEIGYYSAAAFKAGGHIPLAKEFVRFLVEDGWLAHYLDFSGDRFLPPMPKLLDAPFWLDPSDRHRMAAGDAVPDPSAPRRYKRWPPAIGS